MSKTHVLSMREAAEACGVSVDTIKRRRDDGALPGAFRSDDAWGTWLIPVEDLVRAGLHPAAAAEASLSPASHAACEALIASLREEQLELRVELAKAEALAAERDRLLRHLFATRRDGEDL